VVAARHKLDISSVLLIAWAGAAVGGVVGWVVGLKAGRALITAPGPLRRLRLNAVARGEDVFRRYPVIAIVLTPSWIAGIHRVGAAIYLPVNAIGAALWAVGIGVGAYLLGPTVIDLVDDLGLVTGVALGALLLLVAWTEIRRRVRRARRPDSTATDP
jgi:membrane-associated protein